jgi:hypothetical protein
MLHTMTWQQFREWQAFDAMDPIGKRRTDWQAASICAVLMNIATRGKRRFNPADFLLQFKEDATKVTPPRADWRKMKMIAQMWAASGDDESPRGKRKGHGRRS